MINTLNVSPKGKLKGREKFSVTFVENKDIENKKILDVGCGYGWMELALQKKGAKDICGIEYREKDLATAKKYIKESNIEFKVGSAIDIPYKDASFDTVISWEVIEHIPKGTEQKMLSEINRVLKKGGVCYLSTPFRSLPSVILDPAWWLIGHRHYSVHSLVLLALKNNFSLERLTIRGKWWTLFSILNMYISKWVLRQNSPLTKFLEEKDTAEYTSVEGFDNIFIKIRKN